MQKLKDKIAIVTGGSTGIGRACAEIFILNGAKVIIADVNQKEAEIFCSNYADASFVKTDVTNEDQIKDLFQKTFLEFGRIDILLNNAGIEGEQDFTFDTDPVSWQKVLNVNLTGTYLALKYVTPFMMQNKKGSIINMSSVCGMRGTQRLSAYAASKAAVINLTQTTALECAPYFVRINAISPSVVNTALLQHFIESSPNPSAMRAGLENYNPMPGLIPIEAVANAALFLASDQAEFITGINLPVDGGFTAR